MTRLIKRYASRKLYDVDGSCYVALEEIEELVRSGEDIQVVDTETGQDVTSHTLMRVILHAGERGDPSFPASLLHDLIRRGEQVLASGLDSLNAGVEQLVDGAVDVVPPLRTMRDEMRKLRRRIDALEDQIARLEARLK